MVDPGEVKGDYIARDVVDKINVGGSGMVYTGDLENAVNVGGTRL